MAAFREQGIDLTFPGAPSHLKASQISTGFFSTLGAKLALGREFTLQENQPGGTPAVVISNQLWRERFGSSPEALGKNVTLDGVSYSIVGVAPPGFRFNDDISVYTPLGQLDPLILNNRGSHDGLFSLRAPETGSEHISKSGGDEHDPESISIVCIPMTTETWEFMLSLLSKQSLATPVKHSRCYWAQLDWCC